MFDFGIVLVSAYRHYRGSLVVHAHFACGCRWYKSGMVTWGEDCQPVDHLHGALNWCAPLTAGWTAEVGTWAA